MKLCLWIFLLYLTSYIQAQQGTSDQIALVLREEWLARNLADGELKQFHEEEVITEHQIQFLREKNRGISKSKNFTIIRGVLTNENNSEVLLPEDLNEFVNFLSNQFNATVFDKSNFIQMINKTDQGKVEFLLMVPWHSEPTPDLSPKKKSKLKNYSKKNLSLFSFRDSS